MCDCGSLTRFDIACAAIGNALVAAAEADSTDSRAISTAEETMVASPASQHQVSTDSGDGLHLGAEFARSGGGTSMLRGESTPTEKCHNGF